MRIMFLCTLFLLNTFSSFANSAQLSHQEREILDLTNDERKHKGLKKLRINPILMEAAQNYAEKMARAEKLTHQLHGQDFCSRIKKTCYAYRYIGENIAWTKRGEKHVVRRWMRSSIHRRNILNSKFSEIGIGIHKSKSGRTYCAQIFGHPK